jgi:hypothetical protein
MHQRAWAGLAGILSIAFSATLFAQSEVVITPENFDEDPIYSPFVGRDYPDQVLFGDTHFHTELSFDAGMIGTRLDVDDAYRFARGEKVISNTGQPVQLVRPPALRTLRKGPDGVQVRDWQRSVVACGRAPSQPR